jgi:hypothetical protein
MARTDTLGNFLTDVAESIRTKEGTTEAIPASEFDSRISNLSGAEDLDEELDTYNNEVHEQETIIENIVEGMANKGIKPIALRLEDVSVLIIEQGKGTVLPSEGYDGIRKVDFDVQMINVGATEYAQDGLVALWDARDEIDANGRWKSQVGSDYWSVTFTDGGATSLAQLKQGDAIVTDGTVSIRNNVDYYKNGYTIELVGSVVADSTAGVNFLTFDKNLTVHINVNRYQAGVFSPQYGSASDGMGGLDVTIRGLNDGKRHTMVLYLENLIGTRSTRNGTVKLQFSIDGSPWYTYHYSVSGSGSYASNYSTLLSYYSNSGSGRAPSGSAVSAVRVYNRKLTHKELMENHLLDMANYGLEE